MIAFKFFPFILTKMSRLFEYIGFDEVEAEKEKDEKSDEELYEVAKEIIKKRQAASATLLQRRLKIYFSQAQRIIDHFEKEGLIGPMDGNKLREVFIK